MSQQIQRWVPQDQEPTLSDGIFDDASNKLAMAVIWKIAPWAIGGTILLWLLMRKR